MYYLLFYILFIIYFIIFYVKRSSLEIIDFHKFIFIKILLEIILFY